MRSIEEIKADYNDCLQCKTDFDCLGISSNCPKPLSIEAYEYELLKALTYGIPLDRLEAICEAYKLLGTKDAYGNTIEAITIYNNRITASYREIVKQPEWFETELFSAEQAKAALKGEKG